MARYEAFSSSDQFGLKINDSLELNKKVFDFIIQHVIPNDYNF